ncbi:MAG: hypothetical protein ACM3VW_04990 [Bacteroidota bacterium]
MMKTRLLLVALILVGVLAAMAAPAQSNWPRKKLIETGWDQPTTATFRKNIAEMEKQPFDGVVIGAVGQDDEKKNLSLRPVFTERPWKAEWFQSAVDDLKATKSSKLTDNFVVIGNNPATVDWFDDEAMKAVIEHWRIAAWIAKQGGLKGIWFDPEPYTEGHNSFGYDLQPQRDKHTFEEYNAKVRQRGREIMQAIAGEYPDCTMFCYWLESINATAAGVDDPMSVLSGGSQGLLPAFINGWLDVIPPQMTLVDGVESAYLYNSPMQFMQSAVLVKGDAQSLVAPENRAKYRAQIQVSFGIYLDAYVNPPTSNYYIDGLGGPRVDRLRKNVTDGLRYADQYVWIYGEKHTWWPTERKDINTTWESALPGTDSALRFASDPDGYARLRVQQLQAEGKLVELFRNGDFGSDKALNAAGQEVTWKSGAPAGWSTWQAAEGGTFAWDKTVGNAAPGSARASKVGMGCFIQEIMPVKPGERYFVSGTYKLQGQGHANIRVRWQTTEGKWIHDQLDKMIFGKGKTGEWVPLSGVAEVPEGVGKMVILLGMGGEFTDQDVAWYDDVHCYRLD